MKNLVYFLIVFCPTLLFGQELNLDFENWSIINNIEGPNNWITNNSPNYISVEKTSEAYSGDYALNIKSNSFTGEGTGPGFAGTTFVPSGDPYLLEAFVRVDTVHNQGKCTVEIYGFSNGNAQKIGSWETNVSTTSYSPISIPIDTINGLDIDSISIYLVAHNKLDSLGYVGLTQMKVDAISIEMTTRVDNLNQINSSIEISPNPVLESLNINVNNKFVNQYLLWNVIGEVILSAKIKNGSSKLDLSYLPPGVYFISFYGDNHLIKTEKIIKK